MGGILKNENEVHADPEAESFDRKQVLRNTEMNAKLGVEGEKIREQLRHHHADHPENHNRYPKTKAPSALKKGELAVDEGFSVPPSEVNFDEQGISQWDKNRGKTEKITEPNTPYMGTAADTEYYDEDPVPTFDLGKEA